MSFVDDDEAELGYGCKEGGARPNDNLRLGAMK